jgi:hypothetical protein
MFDHLDRAEGGIEVAEPGTNGRAAAYGFRSPGSEWSSKDDVRVPRNLGYILSTETLKVAFGNAHELLPSIGRTRDYGHDSLLSEGAIMIPNRRARK